MFLWGPWGDEVATLRSATFAMTSEGKCYFFDAEPICKIDCRTSLYFVRYDMEI